MDPLVIILVPGLAGGLLLALLVIWRNRESRTTLAPSRDEFPSTDPINAARIRVAGVGGLGLVAMAVAVAVFVPRIRLTLAAGLVLGIVLALVLVARRRARGVLPSSGARSGANVVLAIDASDREREPAEKSPFVQLSGLRISASMHR
jgi:hypothetical protein